MYLSKSAVTSAHLYGSRDWVKNKHEKWVRHAKETVYKKDQRGQGKMVD